jgi:hypothetical protein
MPTGRAAYFTPARPQSALRSARRDLRPLLCQSTLPSVARFHSRPGAPNVLYINFTRGRPSTQWNGAQTDSHSAVAFSSDSDLTTFSDSEQVMIYRIWQRMSEDYAPNIDVTTERPAA